MWFWYTIFFLNRYAPNLRCEGGKMAQEFPKYTVCITIFIYTSLFGLLPKVWFVNSVCKAKAKPEVVTC